MRSVAKQAVFHENENAVLQMTHKNSLFRKKMPDLAPALKMGCWYTAGKSNTREKWIAP